MPFQSLASGLTHASSFFVFHARSHAKSLPLPIYIFLARKPFAMFYLRTNSGPLSHQQGKPTVALASGHGFVGLTRLSYRWGAADLVGNLGVDGSLDRFVGQ